MAGRRRVGVPLLAALLAVAALTGCASRDGLRVEGPAAPVTSRPGIAEPTSQPTARTFISGAQSATLSIAELRTVLLADPAVDPDAKRVLATCPQRCLARGLAADILGNGALQRVVSVIALTTGTSFVAYLVGDVDGEPKVLSTIRGQDMRITTGRNRTLVVESKVYGPTDKTCCPSGSKVEVYHWNGGYLVKLSEIYTEGS